MDLIIKYDSEADVLVVKVKEGALADEELLDRIFITGIYRFLGIRGEDGDVLWNTLVLG